MTVNTHGHNQSSLRYCVWSQSGESKVHHMPKSFPFSSFITAEIEHRWEHRWDEHSEMSTKNQPR